MADLEPGLRTTPRGFVGSCGVTVAENYGVKKLEAACGIFISYRSPQHVNKW